MSPKDTMKQERRSEKFGLHSMKAKIVSLVDGELILMAFLLLFLVTPKATSLMQHTNKNYLQDVTMAYGMMLETQIESLGVEQALDQHSFSFPRHLGNDLMIRPCAGERKRSVGNPVRNGRDPGVSRSGDPGGCSLPGGAGPGFRHEA